MKLHLKENKIEKIQFYSKPDGKTLPIENDGENIYLDGLKLAF